LPGTHDSGGYDTTQKLLIYFEKYVYTQVSKSVGFCLAQVSLTHVVNLSLILKFVRTMSFWVNYATDLRVGFDNQSEHFWWLHHETYPVRPLSHILGDIETFVEATNEIVIVEFHKFQTGISKNPSMHLELYKFVTFYLGKHVAEIGWNKSLKGLQTEGRRVIVTYNHLTMIAV